jgi:hypothetical protein
MWASAILAFAVDEPFTPSPNAAMPVIVEAVFVLRVRKSTHITPRIHPSI